MELPSLPALSPEQLQTIQAIIDYHLREQQAAHQQSQQEQAATPAREEAVSKSAPAQDEEPRSSDDLTDGLEKGLTRTFRGTPVQEQQQRVHFWDDNDKSDDWWKQEDIGVSAEVKESMSPATPPPLWCEEPDWWLERVSPPTTPSPPLEEGEDMEQQALPTLLDGERAWLVWGVRSSDAAGAVLFDRDFARRRQSSQAWRGVFLDSHVYV